MTAMAVYIHTLGCARNLVDSETMAADVKKSGAEITSVPAEAEVIVINTCSFIESAINESVDAILGLAAYKRSGVCRRLIVTGCLPERFREEIAGALPEVDVFLGTGAYDQILQAINGEFEAGSCILPPPEARVLPTHDAGREPSTYPVAYLRIGDGCNRHCTYCIIPKLRGRLRSREMPDIVAEAKALIAKGYKEIVLIAQDTSAYGQDLKPKQSLAALLDRLAGISTDVRIRFLYGSPDHTDDALIATVSRYSEISPYFDLPVQHVSPGVLKRMGRGYTEKDLLQLIENIRSAIPAATLRTTILVGFPGETDADFERLLKFLEAVRFDHAGGFVYSDAEDLAAHRLPDHIPASVARERYDRLMTRQAEISLEKNRSRLGNICSALVEERIDDNLYVGRTAFQAPEVDGITYIESPDLRVGDFLNVRLKEAYAYDLKGEIECPI